MGDWRLLALAMVFLALVGVALAALAASSGDTPLWLAVCCLPPVVFATVWLWARERRYRRMRAEFVQRVPRTDQQTVASGLQARWRALGAPPKAETVLALLPPTGAVEPHRPRLVCLGLIDAPAPADLRFEPVIVTPTHYLWRRLWPVPLGALILGSVAAQWLGVHSMRWLGFLQGFFYFVALGAGAAVLWLWRSTIRPTYLRVAPGIVQIVAFPFGRGKPAIRSYPMTGGTTAILVNSGTDVNGGVTLTLTRNGRYRDEIPLWQMRNRREVIERVLQALVSTAPTPPLSDEDLVG